MRMARVKTGKVKHSGILKTIAGLFALGKNDYADIELFRKDAFFRNCLMLPAIPSEETLRQRLASSRAIRLENERCSASQVQGAAKKITFRYTGFDLYRMQENPAFWIIFFEIWRTLSMVRSFSTITHAILLKKQFKMQEGD